MNEIEDSGKSDNIDYDFSRDYTKFTITASKGCNIKHMATILHQALFDSELYQVFRDQQDWKLLVQNYIRCSVISRTGNCWSSLSTGTPVKRF